MDRKGDFTITHTGIHFWPLDPRPEEVNIEDIAHALSQVTRWGGHAPIRYSVAQHCLRVAARSRLMAEQGGYYNLGCMELMGLLHDASEAYIADVTKPIKPDLTNYYAIEAGIQRAIATKFDVPLEPLHPLVQKADIDLGVTEASVFFPDELWWRPRTSNKASIGGEVLTGLWTERLREEDWRRVKMQFLDAFDALGGKR